MAYLSLGTASPICPRIFISYNDPQPVVLDIFPAGFNLFLFSRCHSTGFTFSEKSLYFFQIFFTDRCTDQFSGIFCTVQQMTGRSTDVFSKMKFVQYKFTFFQNLTPRYDPWCTVPGDIYILKIFCIVIVIDILLYL